ncbi:RNA polymerase II transcription factor B subunit 4 [Onygenales sp. PD_12]|nr:RNA polymerase II transcription factor B subunit 4 [Onygenales sp. PD_12]
MNAVDGSDHYDAAASIPSPALLTVILDTNPHAWAQLEPALPLSAAVASLLVFINAHLACNYANKVAVVASHCRHAAWLYPAPTQTPKRQHVDPDGDIAMNGAPDPNLNQPNKYRPFRLVEEQLTANLSALLSTTRPSDISATASTMMAGALTLALSHINRESLAHAEAHGTSNPDPTTSSTSHPPSSSSLPPPPGTHHPTTTPATPSTPLSSRILIISTSSTTTSAHQYIPIMNSIFACQRLSIPIDILKLSGDAVFLQQASDATRGIYLSIPQTPPLTPAALLQSLLLAFLPDQRARTHLILPTGADVDFRAACFCHRRVVDVGFVCSICLSIFCEPPGDGACLTCGTRLASSSSSGGAYGAKPVVLAVKRKKRKKEKVGVSGNSTTGRGGVSSGTATPTPMPTPGLGTPM